MVHPSSGHCPHHARSASTSSSDTAYSSRPYEGSALRGGDEGSAGTPRIDVRGLGVGMGPAPRPQLWEVPTMSESMALVGLDVHKSRTVAAVLDPVTGELRMERLRGEPERVVPVFLEKLDRAVVAVYEAGPTGFVLARVAEQRGLDIRVVAPGSIPRAPGDRVKTDRRDAKRLVRLLAAGAFRFAFVPSETDGR